MPQCIDQPLLCRIWPLLSSSDSEVTNCEHSCVHYCASLSYFAYYKDCAHRNSTTRSHCSFCQRFSVNIEYLFGVVSFRLCFFFCATEEPFTFCALRTWYQNSMSNPSSVSKVFTSQNSATESYAVFLSSRFSEKSLLTPDETRHAVGTISKVCLELRRTK